MTVHVVQQLGDGMVLEVCDHMGTLEAIETPDVSGERCTECGRAWWRDRHRRPWLPDPQWGASFTRVRMEASEDRGCDENPIRPEEWFPGRADEQGGEVGSRPRGAVASPDAEGAPDGA